MKIKVIGWLEKKRAMKTLWVQNSLTAEDKSGFDPSISKFVFFKKSFLLKFRRVQKTEWSKQKREGFIERRGLFIGWAPTHIVQMKDFFKKKSVKKNLYWESLLKSDVPQISITKLLRFERKLWRSEQWDHFLRHLGNVPHSLKKALFQVSKLRAVSRKIRVRFTWFFFCVKRLL